MQAERENEGKEADARRRRLEEYVVIELERRPDCELVAKKKDWRGLAIHQARGAF